MNRKLRMGMVGGGRGAFIGAVHRMAANLDGKIELVAGAFSSSPEKSKLSGEDFFLDPERVYESYQEMAEKEAAREIKSTSSRSLFKTTFILMLRKPSSKQVSM